jgi:hypothetical protein
MRQEAEGEELLKPVVMGFGRESGWGGSSTKIDQREAKAGTVECGRSVDPLTPAAVGVAHSQVSRWLPDPAVQAVVVPDP